MAYSRIWTDTTPVATDPASGAPIDMQHIRGDLHERLADLFGISDFTTDPLRVGRIRLGYTAFGGYLAHTSGDGIARWNVGLTSGASVLDYTIRDIVNGFDRFLINSTTGNITISNGLYIGTDPGLTGAIGIPNNVSITSRNAANTGNFSLIFLDGTDIIRIGDSNNVKLDNSLNVVGTVTSSGFSGPLTGNVAGNVSGSSGSCTGNAATSSTCTGNAATATLASNSTNLGGVAASSYALKAGSSAITVTGASVTAAAFYVV